MQPQGTTQVGSRWRSLTESIKSRQQTWDRGSWWSASQGGPRKSKHPGQACRSC